MQVREKEEFGKCKALLVEDDRLIREILSHMLRNIGFGEVVEAGSAEDAWAHLSGPDSTSFDIVITDLTLPGASGATLIQNLRGLCSPPLSSLPVIVLTGNLDPASYSKIQSCGVASYLIKPITINTLRGAASQALVRGGSISAARS